MHALAIAVSFVCITACVVTKSNEASTVPAKSGETVQHDPPAQPAETAKPDSPEETPEPVALTDDEMWELVKILYAEGIGPVQMDMPAPKVIEAMGQPNKRGKEEVWEASGERVQVWSYQGMELQMARESKRATQKVLAIKIDGSSALATKRGIRIGSSREDVARAYAREHNAEESEPASFVAGSVYDGLLIDFENDVVTSMFLGAAAE